VKRFPGRDPELVLEVLEDCLRAVLNDVVREGKRITLFGLGPSPRRVNRNDTTVIDVKAEDGVTIIDADVRYQASAFLGTAPQDAVVQAKLDQVFEAMLAQLGLERWYGQVHEQAPVAVDKPVIQVENAAGAASGDVAVEVEARENSSLGVVADEPQLDEDSVTMAPLDPRAGKLEPGEPESASVAEEVKAVESPVPEGAEPKAATVVEAGAQDEPALQPVPTLPAVEEKATSQPESASAESKASEIALTTPAVEQKETAEQSIAEQQNPAEPQKEVEPATVVANQAKPAAEDKSVVTSSVAKSKLELVARTPPWDDSSKTTTSQSAVSPHRESNFEEEDAKRSRRLKWSAWIAAIVVLVVAPAAWLFLPSHLQEETTQPHPQAQQPTLVATSQAAPVQPVPVPVAAKLPGTDEDPGTVINEWETSMRSGDAAAQAAFYADPVDRYFLRRNVGRNEVVTAKQASIDKRKGVWTVKMERVKVTRPNDRTARVSLIKHYMVQDGGASVSESFVPSVLQLVRADGRWQISSERDLGWAPTMDDLEE
jgi:ketosteroid isomerase-like protein